MFTLVAKINTHTSSLMNTINYLAFFTLLNAPSLLRFSRISMLDFPIYITRGLIQNFITHNGFDLLASHSTTFLYRPGCTCPLSWSFTSCACLWDRNKNSSQHRVNLQMVRLANCCKSKLFVFCSYPGAYTSACH